MSDVSYIASVSGGKDSTAMCLHLREQGLPFRAVFFDTGWEHPTTYDYVRNVLPDVIGGNVEIRSREPVLDPRREGMAVELEQLLGFRSPMVRWLLKRGMFPSRQRRFCTQELKVYTCRDVMREEHAAGRRPVNVVGIRRAESVARSKLDERELSTTLDCMVWRPLIAWSERQVIEIHQRHGVPPNPLYLRGANRVRCWPCIMAGKSELKLLARDEPRIRVIERIEELVTLLAQERYEAKPPAAKWVCGGCKGAMGPEDFDDDGAPFSTDCECGGVFVETHRPAPKFRPPAFFQGNRNHRGKDGTLLCVPIRKHVAWGLTTRGGLELDRQASLPGLNDGCMRWGMCELVDGER